MKDDPLQLARAREEACGAISAGKVRTLEMRGLEVVNLFAWRSTDPRALPRNPTRARGPANPEHLRTAAREARMVVVGWGTVGGEMARAEASRVLRLLAPLQDLYCLGTRKDGAPLHPLYLSRSTPIQMFRDKGGAR